MPITSRFFVRSTITLLVVALLALMAIVGTVIWLGERSQVYFDEVLQARDARTAAVDLRNALRVMETGQRGFIITGDERYLENYGAAKELVPQRYETLRTILEPFPEATEAVAALKTNIDGKMAEMDETVALERNGQHDEAVAVVRTDRGKVLMDDAVQFLIGVINAADERLTTGIAEQRTSAEWLRWVSILGGVLIIAVVGGSAITVWRYTKELGLARDEVQALNAGLEERVKERTSDLSRANDEIQRFAYIVTHDLRAPLVNIMGFTSELEASLKSIQTLVDAAPESEDPNLKEAQLAAKEDLPEAISFIRSSTKKMDALINAILKLSREGRRVLRAERVDLGELLKNAAAANQHQVAEAAGEITVTGNVPTLVTDKLSLEQIFGNLLDNAVKYRAKDRPLQIAVRATAERGNRIVVEVEDNGRGIAETDLERVFELFRRSGVQDQPGEGIGLAYVRTVARNLGGDVTVSSKLNQGTTFTVTLPRQLQVPGSKAA